MDSISTPKRRALGVLDVNTMSPRSNMRSQLDKRSPLPGSPAKAEAEGKKRPLEAVAVIDEQHLPHKKACCASVNAQSAAGVEQSVPEMELRISQRDAVEVQCS